MCVISSSHLVCYQVVSFFNWWMQLWRNAALHSLKTKVKDKVEEKGKKNIDTPDATFPKLQNEKLMKKIYIEKASQKKSKAQEDR